MKNSLRIHKWTHNEFNIFILGVLTHPPTERRTEDGALKGTAQNHKGRSTEGKDSRELQGAARVKR